MKITRIQLKNWKNFKDVDVTISDRIFLIGPNASGKSNFLNALLFMHDVAEHGLKQGIRKHLWNLADFASSVEKKTTSLIFTFDEGWEYELEITLPYSKMITINEIVINREVVFHKKEEILSRPDEKDIEDPARLMQTALEQVSVNKEFRSITSFFKSIVYQNIIPQAVRDPNGFSIGKISNDPYGRDIISRICNTEKNLRDVHLEKISNVLQNVIPNFTILISLGDDKNPKTPTLTSTHVKDGKPQSVSDEKSFSDGTLRLIALLWTLLEAKGPVLLEEPEISLHSAIVEKLPSIFAQMVRTNKDLKQIFVTTHSEILLSDQGIGANEILRLEPDVDGTKIILASDIDKELLENDLTPAEVFLPQTRPKDIDKLGDL